ncbi:MAG: GNAT family N-acetyltransferase [Actinomycetota bacterium]
MPAAITIRPLADSDAPVVAALSGDLGYPADQAAMEIRLATVLADPGHTVFGAEAEDGSLLGWVHVCSRLLLIDPPSTLVEGLVVGPDARRQGVGRALMAAAEDWSCSRGALTIRLRTGATREDTHAFYRALGYSPGKLALGFEKALDGG